MRMTWNRIYRATSYVRSALWTVPFVAAALVIALAPILRWLDHKVGLNLTGLDVAGAQALYQTVITLTLTFLVFIFGSLLVAIQIAGGQLTPRIIATTLLRDNVVRYSVGLFVFTLTLAVTSLNRMQGEVQQLVALIVVILGISCLAVFLFMIDYAARLLRPGTILKRVGDMGLVVIDSVYPDPVGDGDAGGGRAPEGPGERVIVHRGESGVLIAIDTPALIAEARRTGGVIELVPHVGDFVASGEPLARLHGGAAAASDEAVVGAVAFGSERTLEQDPMFAFRIIADIGLKALSPAINDPTTGTLAIDQLHRLLRVVGRRRLRGDTIHDDEGVVRVVVRTPNWEDFVHMAFKEIRACGAGSMQIARRMRAMLEDLLRLLPPHRHPSLEVEAILLDRALQAAYPFPEDLEAASVPDIQGMGSAMSRGMR
jgi:uncharacterized membrane protein